MHFNGRHLFALLLCGTGIAAWGHCPENMQAEEWIAQWIGPPAKITQEARQNSWWCFRKDIQVASAPEKCEIKIACDSKYWLWVNGELAVLEGGLKRGPTPTGTYNDVVDIASYLRRGDNQIAILLWHFGKHGFSHNDSGTIGLIVDGECDDLTLQTDDPWKVLRHPAFEDAGDPQPNYRLPEGNIRFDARRTMPDWQTASNLSQWDAAKEYGIPPAGPWGELMERPILQWKDFGIRNYEGIIETTADQLYKRARLRNPERIKLAIDEAQAGGQIPDTRRVMVGTLPYNCHVHPIMSITAPAGLEIDIQTDLVTNGRDGFLRAEYVTREGRQEFELPGWLNGHEVRYFLPEGVDVHKIQYRETGYNAEFTGSFECDDERLNILWEKARRTLYVTMRDTYMDCPDRERAQWWGDAVNELGEAFYVFDARKGPLLAKKGILELAAYQRADKTLYSPVPAGVPVDDNRENPRDGSWNRELPRQMLASVGFYGFWNYYRNTGDAETIRTVYPAVRDYLSVWELDDRGLVVHRTGEWDWTDWGQNFDVAVLENAWYYLALKGAVEMASLLDLPDDAIAYRERMERIEGGFNKTFWQGAYYRSSSHEGETDDRANGLAVVAGLANPEYYPAITEFLKTNMHASPYMEKYVLEALFLMGEPEAGIARIHQRYGSMIDCDETTLWENFAAEGSGEPGSGTYNHAWSGGPLTMMHQYIAGIEPIESGWKRFSVKPQLGALEHVETVVPTPYGNIEVIIDRKDVGGYNLQLIVPDGATAELKQQGTFKELPSGTHRLTVSP